MARWLDSIDAGLCVEGVDVTAGMSPYTITAGKQYHSLKDTTSSTLHAISATNDGQTMSFNVTIVCMDVIDISKEETKNIFDKNSNEHDVLNTQLAVTNRLYQLLHNGQLRSQGYQVDTVANCEPFVDRFSNNLGGWAITFDIMVKNDLYIC